MIIELEHIEKTYGTGANKVPVLHDVNLKVEAGEYIAIMGPSGSGKSTLMNILGYLDVPTSGVYRFDGQDNAKAGDARMARLRNATIGFVFQSFHLMQRRRAWENVALPLMYGNVKRSERKRRAEEALNQVGLGDRIN
ncbi:MAG: ATP-binding cassette domain-containing protein, partial [Clostridia bacterium]|nr:ATP-binding cassette domain-containing protein [Clostridia bacterium]